MWYCQRECSPTSATHESFCSTRPSASASPHIVYINNNEEMMIPVIVRPDAGTDVEDVRRLAAQRSVPVEERSDLHYACVGFMQAPLTDAADSTRHNSGPRRARNERETDR